MSAPGVVAAVVPGPVGLIDLYPTVAELLGVARPQRLQGRSLVPALRGASVPDWPYRSRTLRLAGELGPPAQQVGLVLGPSKLVRRTGWNLDELYDLAADPGERRDLAATRPERLRTLRQVLAGH